MADAPGAVRASLVHQVVVDRAVNGAGATLSIVVLSGRFVNQVVRIEAIADVTKVRAVIDGGPLAVSDEGNPMHEERCSACSRGVTILLGGALHVSDSSLMGSWG